ncbi:MAG: hypothetical protein RIR18_1019 [Pseudomonadota bacterium]|jgi:hypothetical protein
MIFDQDLLNAIAEAVRIDASAQTLRLKFPGIHFTECSEDDISPRILPTLDAGAYLLYPISGKSGHCLEFTADLANATGIVVAAKADEE